jgi:hypothetical protein
MAHRHNTKRNILNFLRACRNGDYRKASRCYPKGYDINRPTYLCYDNREIFYPYYVTPMINMKYDKYYPTYAIQEAVDSGSKEMIKTLVVDYGQDLNVFEHLHLRWSQSTLIYLIELGFYIPLDVNIYDSYYFGRNIKKYWNLYRKLIRLITRQRIDYQLSSPSFNFPTYVERYQDTKLYIKYLALCYNLHTFPNKKNKIYSYGQFEIYYTYDCSKESVPTLQHLCFSTIVKNQIQPPYYYPEMLLHTAYQKYTEHISPDWIIPYESMKFFDM